MPLRGSLFRKIKELRATRRAKQFSASIAEATKEAVELKEFRKRRVQKEGKAALEETLAEEKRRISKAKAREKIARGPGTATRVGKFLIGAGRKAAASPTTRKGTKFVARELGLLPTKKPGRKKKRKKRKLSLLEGGSF